MLHARSTSVPRQLPDAARARVQGRFSQALLDETFEIETPCGPLKFVILGRGASIRAMSALTKQPATIEWIDSFSPGSVFWDVGANVGVYALYAARRGDAKVVAFEPAAVNFFLCASPLTPPLTRSPSTKRRGRGVRRSSSHRPRRRPSLATARGRPRGIGRSRW